jgi:protein-disulfide isomerase
MRRRSLGLAVLATLAALPLAFGAAPARGAPCDALTTAPKRALVDALVRTQHPYDCCDETIAECLRKPKVCRLARRLRDDICRRVGRGETRATIERALTRRAESMTPLGRTARFDLAAAPVAGDPRAKVTVVVYACARCPLCATLVPEFYRAIASGPLKGKVKLHYRSFPIRAHEDSAAANLAFQAAHTLGAFWPFLLHASARFDEFAPQRLPDWAKAVGLDPAAFSRALTAPAVRDAVVSSKKEGIVNRVEATPTLFISGRRYTVDLDLEAVLDALAEEADRVAGAPYED